MKVNHIQPALEKAAELLRYQNKQLQVKRMEENLKDEKVRLQRLKPTDPTKGSKIDITV